ncbi:MAG: CRISPR-associated protein Cas4 [Bacteroidia bacterium]|nr:CRISPR-associated protein Cas4 [Bacteroidia bacterium]
MQHRGEIIKEAVYKSGFPITELAKRMGKSRRWVYLLFDNPTVSIDTVLQIGAIIHYDFSDEIETIKPHVLNDSAINYSKEEVYWKNKYLKLLEEYNELLKKKK